MARGKVKWFNNAKGYGFIRPDTGGDDLFVHFSYVEMEGYKSLKAGEPVEYDVREAPLGLHAINVICLEPRIDEHSEQNDADKQETAETKVVSEAY